MSFSKSFSCKFGFFSILIFLNISCSKEKIESDLPSNNFCNCLTPDSIIGRWEIRSYREDHYSQSDSLITSIVINKDDPEWENTYDYIELHPKNRLLVVANNIPLWCINSGTYALNQRMISLTSGIYDPNWPTAQRYWSIQIISPMEIVISYTETSRNEFVRHKKYKIGLMLISTMR